MDLKLWWHLIILRQILRKYYYYQTHIPLYRERIDTLK